MGCDIHLHMEIKVDGNWHTYASPSVNRNYRLFAKMANVRNSYEIEPIALPRGLPDDISKVVSISKTLDNYHSHSYLTAEELHILDKTREVWDYPLPETADNYDRLMRYGMCDLFGYFFGNTYAYCFESKPEQIQDVRAVFWFDN